MTDPDPRFGERITKPPRPTPSKGARIAAATVGIFLLVLAVALTTPFVIALWKWAFEQ